MRTARLIHWGLRRAGKLNERRYHRLLRWELQHQHSEKGVAALVFGILRKFYGPISWRVSNLLIKSGVVQINGKSGGSFDTVHVGDIVQTIWGPGLVRVHKQSSNYANRVRARAKRASYMLAIRQSPAKRVVKAYRSLDMLRANLGTSVALDPAVGVASVIKKFSKERELHTYLLRSSVLTLYNWRYRFD